MDRRLFLSGGLASLALSAPARAQLNRALPGDVVPSVDPRRFNSSRATYPLRCRVRQDVANLTTAQLTAFKVGVAAMKARPANDPTSWAYQAAMHGTINNPPLALWNGCQHGSPHFFSWHRLFLFYFERILRKASGSPNLTLPFWNWQTNRALPAAFLDATPGNPLFTADRDAGMNSGALMPLSAVATTSSFSNIPFLDFSSEFEGTPHGAVHVSVGGGMSSVPTAAPDPIFWLHHANVDRLWDNWLAQGVGRADPVDAGWSNQTFDFFDENGHRVTRQVADTVNDCASLGYVYEPPRALRFTYPVYVARLLPLHVVISPIGPGMFLQRQVLLGPRPARIALPLPDQRSLADGRVKTLLSFEQIRVRDPNGFYEIYLNPRSSENLTAADPSYAGNLVLFGVPIEGQPITHVHTTGRNAQLTVVRDRRVFDISGKLLELNRLGLLSGNGKLDVVLVLRLPEGGRSVVRAPDHGPRALIGAIRLVTR